MRGLPVNSTIIGPVLIAAESRIEDAFIGPFTSVGTGSAVRRAEVEYSIVSEHATVEDLRLRLQESVIGVGAVVRSRSGLPRAHRLVIGDESVVEIG